MIRADIQRKTIVRQGGLGTRRVVAFGSRPGWTTTLSDGVQTQETSRIKYVAVGNVYDMSVVYSNLTQVMAVTNTGVGDMTITASLESPAGTFKQITFGGGNTSYLLKVDSRVVSDVLLVDIPDGTIFWVRTCVTVASGVKWAKQGQANDNYSEGLVTGSDATMSGNIANFFGTTFTPTAIIGNSTSNKASVITLGDSLSSGQGDSVSSNNPFSYGGGIFGRALGAGVPNLICNMPAQAISHWASNKFRLSYLFPSCHYFICNLGINDFGSAGLLSTYYTNYIAVWDSLRAVGVYGYQTTITPNTTSTDSFATTANQTVTVKETKRPFVNAWIRDGAPLNAITRVAVAVGDTSSNTVRAGDPRHPLIGYFEVADTVETARDSGIWKAPGYTNDGLHGTATSYPFMAAAIDTSKFLLW